MSLLSRVIEKIRLHRFRSDEYENCRLREWFRREFDVTVGLYSYGCFDRHRIQGPIEIGRYCSFARTARVINANHPFEALTTHPYLYESAFGIVDHDYAEPRRLVVEDDVWIGHNVLVTPGCNIIGRGSILAAGSVVTSDVPRYAIVGGVPARLIRPRFPSDVQDALEESRWWEADKSQLAELIRNDANLVRRLTPETVSRLLQWSRTRHADPRGPDGKARAGPQR